MICPICSTQFLSLSPWWPDARKYTVRVRFHPHRLKMGREALRLQTSEVFKRLKFKIHGGYSQRMHVLVKMVIWFRWLTNYPSSNLILYVSQRRDTKIKKFSWMENIDSSAQIQVWQDHQLQELPYCPIGNGLQIFSRRSVWTTEWWPWI